MLLVPPPDKFFRLHVVLLERHRPERDVEQDDDDEKDEEGGVVGKAGEAVILLFLFGPSILNLITYNQEYIYIFRLYFSFFSPCYL